MSTETALLLVNAGSTLALTGLIWTVQLVHYPSFHYVSKSEFVEFEAFHQRRITSLVAPLMLIELATTVAIIGWRPPALPAVYVMIGAVLLLAIWLCTFAVQVPLHNRLSHGSDRAVIGALIHSNWIRTSLWSIRACLVLWGLQVVSFPAEPIT